MASVADFHVEFGVMFTEIQYVNDLNGEPHFM
jgi:hypothetical protein